MTEEERTQKSVPDLVKELEALAHSEPINGLTLPKAKTTSPPEPTTEVKSPTDTSFVPMTKFSHNIDQEIEKKADELKKQWIDDTYKRLFQILYHPSNLTLTPSLPMPQNPQSTSENVDFARRQIDIAIMDGKPMGIKDMYKLKKMLQGNPVSDSEIPAWVSSPEPKSEEPQKSPVSSKQSSVDKDDDGEPKKYSAKVGIAVFALAIVVSFGVIYLLGIL